MGTPLGMKVPRENHLRPNQVTKKKRNKTACKSRFYFIFTETIHITSASSSLPKWMPIYIFPFFKYLY